LLSSAEIIKKMDGTKSISTADTVHNHYYCTSSLPRSTS
jgi:hypothetical protein